MFLACIMSSFRSSMTFSKTWMLTVFMLQDLSVACDLVSSLHKINVSDRSNLRVVSVGNFSFSSATITFGVPQGSILCPLLFVIYMIPLRQVIHHSNISFPHYADDTLTVTSSDLSSVNSLISSYTDF